MRITLAALVLATCAACAARPPAAPLPPAASAAPAPAPDPRTAPARSSGPIIDEVRVRVLRDGALATVVVQYRAALNDTLYNGLPFAHTFPITGAYAHPAGWYQRGEPIRFGGRAYVKYGLPRILGIDDVARIDEYRGVGVYAEAGPDPSIEVIYVPVSTGCVFQAYRLQART